MSESYYTLQLSLYAIPLQNIGFEVIARRLIWVKPDGTYESIRIKDVSDRIREALDIPDSSTIISKNML